MPRWVAGVDACKRGWIVAFRDLDAPHVVRVRVEPTIEAVLDAPERPSVVAVDMPIGLPERAGRAGRTADQLARDLLGQRRGTVFPTSRPKRRVCRDLHGGDRAVALPGDAAICAVSARLRDLSAHPRDRSAAALQARSDRPCRRGASRDGVLGDERRRARSRAEDDDRRAADAAPALAGGRHPVVGRQPHAAARRRQGRSARCAGQPGGGGARGARARPLPPDPPETDEHGIPMAIWTPGPRSAGLAAATAVPSPPPRVSRDDIRAAHARIAPHVRRTPVWQLPARSFGHDGPVSLKLEMLQHAGSFKPRGAFNTLLSQPIPRTGIAAASGGNHGAAVAYAARRLGLKARIFVPEISSPAKIAVIRAHGADDRHRRSALRRCAGGLRPLCRRDRSAARAPLRRGDHDRRPGHGRARMGGGRSASRHGARRGRRRRPDRRHGRLVGRPRQGRRRRAARARARCTRPFRRERPSMSR